MSGCGLLNFRDNNKYVSPRGRQTWEVCVRNFPLYERGRTAHEPPRDESQSRVLVLLRPLFPHILIPHQANQNNIELREFVFCRGRTT
jgi:hypothetical protein